MWDLTPSGKGAFASCTLVQFHENNYTYAQLGDCILLEKRNGQWTQITIDKIKPYDEIDINYIHQLLAPQGIGLKDKNSVAEAVDYMLEKRQEKLNKKYGVFNGAPEVAEFIDSGQRSLKGVEALCLVCDGFEHPVKGFVKSAERIEEVGFKAYFKEIKSLYDADPDFTKLPRFKHMDDSTGIFIQF